MIKRRKTSNATINNNKNNKSNKKKLYKRIIVKGFTLVELLAVIVILGVLIGIAFPSISRRIRETRDKTYDLHEADMKTATMNLMSECVKNGEECVPNGESRTYYLSELIARKYSEGLRDPEDTDNYCDEEKSYVVVKNDSDTLSNFEYEVCLVCSNYESGRCKEGNTSDRCENIDDSEGPDCGEVTGGSTIWTNSDRVISVGCKDKGGCGCSQDVYYKRFSETMEKGQIEIKDRKGNTTVCPVNVYIDKNKPECELEVIGTMGENGWYGNEAPRVVFKSKTDSESGIESFGLGTSSKEYNFNREEEYIVTRGVTTVYGYVRDNAGNVGVCHTNSIKYDDVKPTITNVRYGYQVYPKEDIATVSGNTINLNYITSEYGTIYGAYIYFKGNVSGNSSISNGNTNLVNRTLSGVNKMEYTFNAGNYNNIKITVPNVNNVEKVELLTGLVNTSYYTNKDVTIYINSHDSYSGKAYYTFDGKTYQKDNYKVYPKNTSGIVVGVKDYAGNKGENQTTAITNIDKIAPNPCVLTKSGTVGVEEWYRSDVTISINGTDKPSTKDYIMSNIRDYDVTTGSKATNYRNPASGVQRTDTSSTYWNGFVKDKAGNTNTCKIEVKRDTVKPTCSVVTKGTYGDNQWYVTNVNISFSDKYDERSGLYKNGDITTSETSSNNGHTPVTHSTDTKGITYYGHVQDKAGNYGRCQIAFKRDATLPTCTLKSAGTYKNWPWYTSNVTITLESTTDATSGIATSGLDTSSSNNFNKKTTQTQTKDTKGTTYYGHVKDNAGNMNTCNIVAHKDTKAPTCKVNFTNSGVSCTGSDVTSGPASCVTDKTAVSVGNYKGTVTDNAGFTNTCSGSVIYTHDRYTRTQHYCDRKAASYTCSYCCSWKKTCYYSTAATGVSGNIQFTCSGLPSNYDCYSNSPSSCTGKVYDSSGNYVGSTTTRPNLNYGGCTGCSGNYCSSTCYEYYQSYCSSSNGRSVYSTNWSYYMNDNYSSSNVDYSCSSTSSFTCNSGKYKSSYYTCSSPWKVCDSGYTKLNETYCYSN